MGDIPECSKLTEGTQSFEFRGHDYFYKIVDPDDIDVYIYEKLKGSTIIPDLLSVDECYYNNKKSLLIKTERYDGTFYDYVNKEDPPEDELINSIREIIFKSLLLNCMYKIRHGDFHQQNIVFKRTPVGVKWAFIDFELATQYDENLNIIKGKGYEYDDGKNPSFYKYNASFDLFNFVIDLMMKK